MKAGVFHAVFKLQRRIGHPPSQIYGVRQKPDIVRNHTKLQPLICMIDLLDASESATPVLVLIWIKLGCPPLLSSYGTLL